MVVEIYKLDGNFVPLSAMSHSQGQQGLSVFLSYTRTEGHKKFKLLDTFLQLRGHKLRREKKTLVLEQMLLIQPKTVL